VDALLLVAHRRRQGHPVVIRHLQKEVTVTWAREPVYGLEQRCLVVPSVTKAVYFEWYDDWWMMTWKWFGRKWPCPNRGTVNPR
jgi:hypothetical protein